MPRITSIDPETATGRAKELLDATNSQLGRTPNLYRSMAQAPAALDGYLAFRGALVKGVLTTELRERIALLVASTNDCGYCVAAHDFRGGKVGITADELMRTRTGKSSNAKTQAALAFVLRLMEKRGRISDDDFVAVREAGWSNEEVGEIVAHVALNVFSNYFNHVATPDLDFPEPPRLKL